MNKPLIRDPKKNQFLRKSENREEIKIDAFLPMKVVLMAEDSMRARDGRDGEVLWLVKRCIDDGEDWSSTEKLDVKK